MCIRDRRYIINEVKNPTKNPKITSKKKCTPRYILLYPIKILQKKSRLIFLFEIRKEIDASENVVDAWDEAKLYFLPHPDTILIIPSKLGSLHGLNLSKNGFIIELVIKSEIITVVTQRIMFNVKFFLSNFQSQ